MAFGFGGCLGFFHEVIKLRFVIDVFLGTKPGMNVTAKQPKIEIVVIGLFQPVKETGSAGFAESSFGPWRVLRRESSDLFGIKRKVLPSRDGHGHAT